MTTLGMKSATALQAANSFVMQERLGADGALVSVLKPSCA
jgi:hypothetical protein